MDVTDAVLVVELRPQIRRVVGIRYIHEVMYLADAFSKDELGWWKDKIYKSLVDTNVYNPDQVPSNWEEQT